MSNIDHTQNIIEVDNVSFAYDNDSILKNVTFNIHKGDYLGVIGPNGGGKTTLLKIILNLIKPTSGNVKIFGQNVQDFKDWQKISYIPQKAVNFDANFPATVEEIVGMGLFGQKGLLSFINAHDKNKIIASLKQVGMDKFQHRLVGDLSAGQQQRVFIAKALVSHPQILFLDEPTVGVDINTQEDFYSLLQKLNRELGITLVMVSHEIDVIAHEATEFACINNTLIYHGDPKEFIKEDYLTKLYGREVKFILHNHA